MRYNSIDVAYRVVEIADDMGIDVNCATLMKYLYFIEGWNSVVGTREQILSERFIKGAFGPRLPRVYRKFRAFNNIINFIAVDQVVDEQLDAIIRDVLRVYSDISPGDCSYLVTRSGSAWHATKDAEDMILYSDIQAEFTALSEQITPVKIGAKPSGESAEDGVVSGEVQ